MHTLINKYKTYVALFTSVICYATTPHLHGEVTKDSLQDQLNAGKYEQVLEQHKGKTSNESLFTQSICELSLSLEDFHQTLYRYGAKAQSRMMGFRINTPLEENPNPKQVSYEAIRKELEIFHDRLHKEENLLSQADDKEFNLPLDLAMLRLDVNEDGIYSDKESNLALILSLRGGPVGRASQRPDTIIHFDKSDLLWLRGYIQITLGLTDIALAHDFKEPFDMISNTIFPKPNNEYNKHLSLDDDWKSVGNIIATLHLMQMDVIEPQRLKNAHQHFLNMTKESRIMMKSVMQETDNVREWIPSPKQDSVTGIKITEEMVKEWENVLIEIESVLNGEALIPHWRVNSEEKGINLKRVFHEAKDTDLILWVTGHAATPYFEEGKVIPRATWRRLNRVFGNNLLGTSFFIN